MKRPLSRCWEMDTTTTGFWTMILESWRWPPRLWTPGSGRLMEVYTDLPGMQFYTGNFLSSQLPGKEGADYGRRHAYCFETQYYPDAVHKENFPSPMLKAGDEYHTVTVYKFLTDGQ